MAGSPPEQPAEEANALEFVTQSGTARSIRKLFLGGIFWETSEATLKEYFSQYGEIEEVIVMRERMTNQPRGFGFITFKTEEAAKEACKQPHMIDGRTIEAKPSIPQSESNKPRSRKIFVGGLAPDTTEDTFREYFGRFGPVAEAQIMMDPISGRSRGFGFVTFAEEMPVSKVFEAGAMHELSGKTVEVKAATPKGSGPQVLRSGFRTASGLTASAATMAYVGGREYMAPGMPLGAAAAAPGAAGRGYGGMGQTAPYAAMAAGAYGMGPSGYAMPMQGYPAYGGYPSYSMYGSAGGVMIPAGYAAGGYGAAAPGYGAAAPAGPAGYMQAPSGSATQGQAAAGYVPGAPPASPAYAGFGGAASASRGGGGAERAASPAGPAGPGSTSSAGSGMGGYGGYSRGGYSQQGGGYSQQGGGGYSQQGAYYTQQGGAYGQQGGGYGQQQDSGSRYPAAMPVPKRERPSSSQQQQPQQQAQPQE